jgi:SAM-dependent methyltransferase
MEQDPYQETIETWNRLAGLYHERFMNLTHYDLSYDFFLKVLPEGRASVLELGCGPGNITRYCLRKRPELTWLATDPAPEMLAIFSRENPSADVLLLDARHLRKVNGIFDAVVAGFCVPYLSGDEVINMLKNTGFRLLPGGLLYLSYVEGRPEDSGLQSFPGFGRCYFYYHRREFMMASLKQQGFSILKEFQILYERDSRTTELHTILVASWLPGND